LKVSRSTVNQQDCSAAGNVTTAAAAAAAAAATRQAQFHLNGLAMVTSKMAWRPTVLADESRLHRSTATSAPAYKLCPYFRPSHWTVE